MLVRVDGLVVGLLVSLPALWAAFVEESMDVTSALLRFLIAVVLFSVAFSGLSALIDTYIRGGRKPARAEPPKRRRSDGS